MIRTRPALKLALLGALTILPAIAQQKPEAFRRLTKAVVQRGHTYFTINNIFSQYANTLEGANNLTSGQDPGLEWPKGANKFVVYEDGFVYGGYYRGRDSTGRQVARKFVNGSWYLSGMTEGAITQYGTGTEPVNAQYQDPKDPSVRVYRVRPDINPYNDWRSPSDFISQLQWEELPLIQRYQSTTAQNLYDQYVKDWNEWPADRGAPYRDVDGNGRYDPQRDTPGVPGADQTLWFVCNDMVSAYSLSFAGGLPAGLEIQKTIWGYNREGSLGNTLFNRFRLINKSGAAIDTLLLAIWSDPDLGYRFDDLLGCDTVRALAYCYNADATDRMYGQPPPAAGYLMLQGPVVPGTSADSAVFGDKYLMQHRNLPMSSFNVPWPSGGEPASGNSTAARDRWWNLLNGRVWTTGKLWTDPNGRPTKFPFSGDPVSGVGWLDGSLYPPGDYTFLMTSGPISLQPGDTNEVVFAEIVAQGADKLSSITALRAACDEVRLTYEPPFGPPSPPALPNVVITPLDGAVLLSWGDPERIKQTEQEYSSKGYTFEGYRVYQTKTMQFKDSVVVATFDRVDPVLDNSGVQHHVLIKDDKINSKPLVNGTTYYFGVSAIAYRPGGSPQILETTVQPLPMIPQSPKLGTRMSNNVFDQIPVTKTDTGNALHVTVAITVIDPTATKTGTYSLTFPGVNQISLSRDGSPVMANYALDATTSSTGGGASPIVEGVQVNVSATFDSSFVPNADTCRFSVTGPTVGDIKLAQKQSAQINVFPNPYFGMHANELGVQNRFVTISHLPQRSIIRIYTVAGYLVRSFSKDSPSQFFQWDLMNSWGKRVAAGVYIIHIDMPDIGATKTMKFGIVPSQ